MQTFFSFIDGSIKKIRVPSSEVTDGIWNGYHTASTLDGLVDILNSL